MTSSATTRSLYQQALDVLKASRRASTSMAATPPAHRLQPRRAHHGNHGREGHRRPRERIQPREIRSIWTNPERAERLNG